MITIEKHKNGLFYIKTFSLDKDKFDCVLSYYKRYNIFYDKKEYASYNKNPHVLLECLNELSDEFETFIPERIKKEIEEFDPFIPSFKIRRKKLEKSFFEKYKPLGQFQIDDVQKMFNFGRVLNANKQGLGKTYEAIQTINQFLYIKEIDKIFIIAIPPVLYNWKREFKKFSEINPEDILILNCDNRDAFDTKNPQVAICSYNTFKLISDYYYKKNNPKLDKKELKLKIKNYRKEQIPLESWGSSRLLICDEAHKLKNLDTRWTRIVHQHKKFFEYRFPMTGTPHPNNIAELYSLVKLLDDDLIEDSYVDFLKSIAVLGTKYSEYDVDHFIDYKVNLFLERIKPYIIRRFLRDEIDIPNVEYKNIYVEFEGIQKDIYQRLINESLIKIKEEKGIITYNDVQVKFPYILQILSDPLLLKDKIISKDSDLLEKISKIKFEDTIKFISCKDIIEYIYEENKDAKIVIWSEHPKTIDTLAEKFSKYGTIKVHGSTTPKGRDKDEWRDYITQEVFRNEKDKRILIANPSTLGVGINLEFCFATITYDEDFSFVNQDQKKSRLERYGLKEEAIQYKLIVDDSIEVYQDAVMKNKELQDKLALKTGLNLEDLSKIFKGII